MRLTDEERNLLPDHVVESYDKKLEDLMRELGETGHYQSCVQMITSFHQFFKEVETEEGFIIYADDILEIFQILLKSLPLLEYLTTKDDLLQLITLENHIHWQAFSRQIHKNLREES